MILIGAGGHAKSIVHSCPIGFTMYCDKTEQSWLRPFRMITEEESFSLAALGDSMVVGFGALTPAALEKRYSVMMSYIKCGAKFSVIRGIHAIVSCNTTIGDGTQILGNSYVNHSAVIGSGCIINTGAIIEHDVVIGDGCHIAPGAIVLGGVDIGDFSFVGAGAVVIQGTKIPPRTFVKARGIWKN